MELNLNIRIYKEHQGLQGYIHKTFSSDFKEMKVDEFLKQVRELDTQRFGCLDDGGEVYFTHPQIKMPGAKEKLQRSWKFLATRLEEEEEWVGRFPVNTDGSESHHFSRWCASDTVEDTIYDFNYGHTLDCFVIPRRRLAGQDSPSVAKKPRMDAEIADDTGGITPSGSGNSIAATGEHILAEERSSIMEKIIALMTQIQTGTPVATLHDPRSAHTIIYPALSPFSSGNKKFVGMGDYNCIRFRGRGALLTVVSDVKQLYYESGFSSPIYGMFGTYGAGINWIALSAAVSLLAQNLPVVVIQLSSSSRVITIRDALLMALSTTTDGLVRWGPALFNACTDGLMGLRRFCNNIAGRIKLIFVFLDIDAAGDQEKEREYLSLAAGHLSWYTASPNSPYFHEDGLDSNGGEKYFYLKGGLSDTEFDGWWSQYTTEGRALGINFRKTTKIAVRDATGCLPFLLENIFQRTVEEKKFQESFLEQTGSTVLVAFESQMKKQNDGCSQEIVAAAITNTPGPVQSVKTSSLYSPDRRFIYRDNGCWTCPCIMVRRALNSYALTHESLMGQLGLNVWIDMLRRVSNNPPMVGFAAENALLCEIAPKGLSILNIFTPLTVQRFHQGEIPKIKQDSSSGSGLLYIPVEFNHRFVDCVIVHFDDNNKTINICPLQITIAKNHSNSCANFFQPGGDWTLWRDAVTIPRKWKIKWSFLWVHRRNKSPQATTIPPKPGQDPSYTEWSSDFKQAGARKTAAVLVEIHKQITRTSRV